MITATHYQATPAQAAARDQLIGQGYKLVGTEEYPTGLKRSPIETVLVLEKWTYTARTAGRRIEKVNPKGIIE